MKPIIFNEIAIYKNAIPNPSQLIDTVNSAVGNSFEDKLTGLNEVQISNVIKFRATTPSSLVLSTPALMGVNRVMHTAIGGCAQHYGEHFGTPIVVDDSPNYSILKYSGGRGYASHIDDPGSPRRVSAVGYLNDNFVGGELDFESFAFRYSPVTGDVLVFPSVAPYFHAAMPVTEGVKYSVINWWA